MRSLSVPSPETDRYFSVKVIDPTEQRDPSSQKMFPLPIFVLSVEPVMSMMTVVPVQTGMRWAVHVSPAVQSESGSMIFPVIK
jgi:hypothetical protein